DLVAAGIRAELDARVETPFGRRAVDAELKGIPLRVEIGPRDLEQGSVTVARRVGGDKAPVALGGLVEHATAALDHDQQALYAAALAHREAHTVAVATVAQAQDAARSGWAVIPWATLGPEGEAQLAESAITVRCLTMPDGSVPASDDEPGVMAVVGRAY
ncbi:MAG: His/Gly/Thr/Pro-type tRNA ligase C-terminal domain-containing protein, partial [Terracoccus sp.]